LRECEDPAQGTIVTEAGPANEPQYGGLLEDGSTEGTDNSMDPAALLKKKQLSFGATEDSKTAPVDTISVGITKPADGETVEVDATAGSTGETVIVVDATTGEALALGAGGNATAGFSYSADGHHTNDGSWNSSVSFEHPLQGEGSEGNDTGISLPFFGKKHNLKKALHKLKHGLIWGADGNSTSDTANCTLLDKCPSGVCLTPSCMLNGAGKDVLTMMCYGTNIIPNPILDHTVGNPCVNLACKLDNPNCTSLPLGIGGFCTGTVVQMGMTAKLHPAGAVWVGHPCMEHKGPLLAMLPKVRYTLEGLAGGFHPLERRRLSAFYSDFRFGLLS
jgi:hypothetical protein